MTGFRKRVLVKSCVSMRQSFSLRRTEEARDRLPYLDSEEERDPVSDVLKKRRRRHHHNLPQVIRADQS